MQDFIQEDIYATEYQDVGGQRRGQNILLTAHFLEASRYPKNSVSLAQEQDQLDRPSKTLEMAEPPNDWINWCTGYRA